MLYQAMFDEMDEATAIFKCTNNTPTGTSLFVTYEGLPSDYYLKLVGAGSQMLRGEIALKDTIPVSVTAVHEVKTNTVKTFSLSQNYPNPFNPSTTIHFSAARDELVTIKIYDVTGYEVEVLVSAEKQAGEYEIMFNPEAIGKKLSSGVYFYKMTAGEFTDTKKLLYLK